MTVHFIRYKVTEGQNPTSCLYTQSLSDDTMSLVERSVEQRSEMMGKHSNVFVNIAGVDCLRMREANIQILLKYLNKVLRLSEATNCIPETSHLWEVLNSKENI